MSNANTLTIINPDDGKRYRLNIKGEIGRLTVGRLKQCLASASTCPIPASLQVLKLNGTSLSNDEDTCAVYGITRGSTLTVEYSENVNPAALNPVSFVSPRRRALEYQTIRLQESALSEDVLISEDVLHAKIEQLQNELQAAEHRKMELERNKARTDRELDTLRQQEALTAQEQQRIIYLRQQEAQRAARRAADLAERREKLKAEESAVRAVALQKLENERRKAELEQQRAIYEAEKERLEQERKAYDQRAKEREMKIREKEMELEQQMLAAERDKRELDFNRFVSHQNRAQYYNRMGLALPPDLLPQSQNPEVEWVASQDGSRSAPRASGIGIGNGNGSGNDVSTPRRGIPQPLRSQPRPAALLSSEADTTTASERMGGHHMGVNSSLPIMHPNAHGKDMYDVHENALANLRCMEDGLALDQPLHFDANNTCVIGIDGQYTLLVTFDATTERLYVYSTLLASIPTDLETRLRVYEFLMEGALLGREMCGGGVGASVKNDFILMSTSIYLPTSHPTTLRVITPLFVQCLNVWRKKLQEFLDELEPILPQAQKQRTQTPQQQQQQQQQQRRQQQTQPQQTQQQQKLLRTYSDLLSVPQERRAHSPKEPTGHSAPSRSGAAAHAVVGIEATDSLSINGVTSRYDAGVLVVNVTGPAAHAGIQIHDFIKKVDGHDVTNLVSFQKEVARLVPGAAVPFVVERGGQMIVVAVKAAAAA